jgi:dethiobiotin synthetase
VRVVVVTGTDTGVGKTVVTAALAAVARARGARVAVVKPAQTGVLEGEPGDLEEVTRLSGVTDVHELARYPDPLAPATAARRAAAPEVSAGQVAAHVRDLSDRDLVLIEGAGGVLVRYDRDGATIADTAAALGARAVLVTQAGLGALNHAALSAGALRARGVDCAGLVVGSWPARPDLATQCNMSDLPDYTGLRLLGRVPQGAGALPPHEFAEHAHDWIETGGLI